MQSHGGNDQAGDVQVDIVMHFQQQRMILKQTDNDQDRCVDFEEAIDWPVRSDWRNPIPFIFLIGVMSLFHVVDVHVHAGTKENGNDRCDDCCHRVTPKH